MKVVHKGNKVEVGWFTSLMIVFVALYMIMISFAIPIYVANVITDGFWNVTFVSAAIIGIGMMVPTEFKTKEKFKWIYNILYNIIMIVIVYLVTGSFKNDSMTILMFLIAASVIGLMMVRALNAMLEEYILQKKGD